MTISVERLVRRASRTAASNFVGKPVRCEGFLSSIERSSNEGACHGRMFLLVDDEYWENEDDLVVPAQMAARRDAINFEATHGRGFICLR